MKVVTVLIVLCFGTTIISSELYGVEIAAIEQWWNADYFLKFNSPSGKIFYIKTEDGTIHRQEEPVAPAMELTHKQLPFISFVSIDFKIYDIFFENADINGYYPRLVESEFVFENRDSLVRPRLDSFVGPNKKVYKIIFNDGYKVDVTEQSPEELDHFEIKTFGPFEKWEHTFVFSENSELVVDHTISPIPVLANRSILLPELEPNIIEKSHNQTVVKFNSPSGKKYYIRDLRNIIASRHFDEEETAYIIFTEPNGRTYDIHIDEMDGHAFLVAKTLDVDENYVRSERLYSFVAPNGILYRIDHKNGSDNEVPVLVSSSSNSSDLHITLIQPGSDYDYTREHPRIKFSVGDGVQLEEPDIDHNKLVKYIFSDNGNRLFDRVVEIDWTPLNELSALPVEEVTEDYIINNLPSLTLYTPSGNNYHIFTDDRIPRIAVEKGTNHSQNLYISYLQAGKRKTNIYFVPGADPYFDEDKTDRSEEVLVHQEFELNSFSTPDQKKYWIDLSKVDEIYKYIIDKPYEQQVKEPDNLPQANRLFIKIQAGRSQATYRFTWNGDKLIEAPVTGIPMYLPKAALISLVGK